MSLNRVFDQALGGAGSERAWVPAMDVAERGDSYVVNLELPGVDAEQVEVAFEQNVLTVRGTKPASHDPGADGEVRLFAAERLSGAFERSVRLPEYVDADRIDASFRDGLLAITIPKSQAARPRRIQLRTAGGEGVTA